MRELHATRHRSQRTGWLRAAVLGANDGILSTAGLIVGVASAQAGQEAVVTAGVAGLVAGALSMAAGEYVSVSSQRDAERADLRRERIELATDAEGERAELAAIYRHRGLDAALALQVADQLTAKDALAAHARDELGISEINATRPVQAALASAGEFCGRCRVAAAGRDSGAAGGDRLERELGIARLPRAARRRRGADRWSTRDGGRVRTLSGARSQWPSPRPSVRCSGGRLIDRSRRAGTRMKLRVM